MITETIYNFRVSIKEYDKEKNYIESTNRIYMEPIIFHLIMSIASPKKYAIIQVGKRITSLHKKSPSNHIK